jgi:NhaP-type Na+/H+ or K+/H+ antiporter
MSAQIITFAFGVVIGMVVIMTPLLLYGFDLLSAGWHWTHAALFVAMIASTDVVAVSAVIKKMNGPETLAVLLEGATLFLSLLPQTCYYVCACDGPLRRHRFMYVYTIH